MAELFRNNSPGALTLQQARAREINRLAEQRSQTSPFISQSPRDQAGTLPDSSTPASAADDRLIAGKLAMPQFVTQNTSAQQRNAVHRIWMGFWAVGFALEFIPLALPQ